MVRGSNCYGPRQHPEKLIPKSLVNLLSDEKIPIYGSGKNIREWIFVEDFCSGVLTALEQGEVGEAYNLGGGDENRVDNLKIVGILASLLGRDLETCIEFVEDRKGHDQRYALNSQKLRGLGWEPKTKLGTGLELTVNWYQNNQDWWKKLTQ